MRLPPPLLASLTAALCIACHRGNTAGKPAPGASTRLGATGTAAPAPTAQSALPPGVFGMLRKYSLTQDDLPPGYGVGGVIEVPNEQASGDYADPQAAIKEMQDTGRLGGLGQQLFPGAGEPGRLGVSIEVFRDASGAGRWAAEAPSLPAVLNPTSVDLDQPLGDRASAIHWKQGAQGGYVVNFSRGRIVYGIGISASAGQESLSPVLDLARRFDQKAKALGS